MEISCNASNVNKCPLLKVFGSYTTRVYSNFTVVFYSAVTLGNSELAKLGCLHL